MSAVPKAGATDSRVLFYNTRHACIPGIHDIDRFNAGRKRSAPFEIPLLPFVGESFMNT